MIVSFELITWCLVAGAAYLLIIDLLWYKLENIIPMFGGFPDHLLESRGVGWFVSTYVIEFVFFVMLPSVIYGWFYTVIPFYGIRGGVAAALFVYILGMIPVGMLSLFRIKLPVMYILYLMFGLLIKFTGIMIIISYLYTL